MPWASNGFTLHKVPSCHRSIVGRSWYNENDDAFFSSFHLNAQQQQQDQDTISSTSTSTTTTTTTSFDPTEEPFTVNGESSLSSSPFSDLSRLLLNNNNNNKEKEETKTRPKAASSSQQQQQQQEESSSSSSSVDDIVCDLDGNPLTKEYFCQAMGLNNNNNVVESYTVAANDAFRGHMSKGCRVHLHPGGQTAFYKRVCFDNLSHAQEKLTRAPHKLKRDIKSYQVVAAFLQSRARQQLMDATVTTTTTTGSSSSGDDGGGPPGGAATVSCCIIIPKCYDAQLEPDYTNPMESKFSFLLQDLNPADGWYQEWLLQDVDTCRAALSTLAKIHAFFWNGSNFWKQKNDDDDHDYYNNNNNNNNNNRARTAQEELEAAVWKSGSYVQPEAQGWKQCEIVAQEWAIKRLKFKTELSNFDYWDNLGERLQSVAQECGRLAHPFAAADDVLAERYHKYRTFTHGDPKQANFLFRRRCCRSSTEETKTDSPPPPLQVGLIDFQWSGFGLAATDIAHFVTSGVHADMLVDGGEDALLRYYFEELQTYLVDFGAYSTRQDVVEHYSYNDVFMDQYETAVLDICRLMIAYTWERFDEPVEKDDEAACARTMNKTSYNKSIPNIVWLLGRCDEILKSRGV